MGEHGILFQDEMVRALLRPVGDPLRKTVTRRTSDVWAKRKPGDLLWVREAHCSADMGPLRPDGVVAYRANYTEARIARDRLGPWKPSIHMPRWASRLTLRVVSLRREQAMPGLLPIRDDIADVWHHTGYLADRRFSVLPPALPFVDDNEARREGVADRAAYLALWESINGPEYPEWVWRIEFEEVDRGR